MKHPCAKECPRRQAGCAVDCPEWADYVKKRDEEYKERQRKCQVMDAAADGYVRCGSKPGQR